MLIVQKYSRFQEIDFEHQSSLQEWLGPHIGLGLEEDYLILLFFSRQHNRPVGVSAVGPLKELENKTPKWQWWKRKKSTPQLKLCLPALNTGHCFTPEFQQIGPEKLRKVLAQELGELDSLPARLRVDLTPLPEGEFRELGLAKIEFTDLSANYIQFRAQLPPDLSQRLIEFHQQSKNCRFQEINNVNDLMALTNLKAHHFQFLQNAAFRGQKCFLWFEDLQLKFCATQVSLEEFHIIGCEALLEDTQYFIHSLIQYYYRQEKKSNHLSFLCAQGQIFADHFQEWGARAYAVYEFEFPLTKSLHSQVLVE